MTDETFTTLLARLNRLIGHPLVKIGVPVLIALIAVVVLHELAAHVHWTDVKADVAAAPWSTIALAVLATIVSFIALSCYDVLAVRSVAKGLVPNYVAALAGGSGYAVSNLLGMSYLTGTAVRYQVYAAAGLDLEKVAGVIATSWIAFWMGLTIILGLLLTLHPTGLSTVLPISAGVELAVGLGLLIAIVGFFIWLATGKKRLTFHSFGFTLPDVRLALGLSVVAVVDIMGAAMTLYVLMPADLVQSYPYFFIVFVGAIAAGILSHAPGGLGVFEATLIAGLGASGRPDVLAALLLYRLIYTILPFSVAVTGLAFVWTRTRREAVVGAADWVYRIVRPIIPIAASGVAVLAGTILLVSGNLPGDAARLDVLRDFLPLSVIEASHLLASVVGALLLVVARGLFRKLWRAWVLAMLLLVVGFFASLAKGLDWEEALTLLATIVVLGTFRGAFYRVQGASIWRLNTTWIVSLIALMLAIFWVGFFAYSNVDYRDTLWWDFALNGDASRFLRSSLVVALVLAGIALNSVLGTRGGRVGAQPIPDVVRELALGSENTEAQISLLGDKAFLVAPDSTAFLAYADTGVSLISYGDPVGAEKAGSQLIWRLREAADKAGKKCAFYGVSQQYLPTYLDLGLSILKIGEVGRVSLKEFTLDGPAKKDFRYAKGRAAREGYKYEVIPRAELSQVLPELRALSDKWLAAKQGEEKSFALGGFDDAYLSNFDHAVLRHGETGRIVAFANLFKGGNKHELSLDLMRYDTGGPNFAMDALFAEMMLWGAAQGYHWFSLGAAPFSGLEHHELATLWNRIGGFLYEHGEAFYHFEGLRAFKEKFGPVWSPHYLASPGGFAVPRILYEVNVLVSGGLKGLMK
jgi:phosphatidylglycerol lysyltransferase